MSQPTPRVESMMPRSQVFSDPGTPSESDEDDDATDGSNPDASFESAVRPLPVFGLEPPPEYGPAPPPGLIARLRRVEARAARVASSDARGSDDRATALPAVEAERKTKVKFTAETLFPERAWSRGTKEAGVVSSHSVRVAEGYTSEKLRKHSIRVHKHLAVLRAKLWRRDV